MIFWSTCPNWHHHRCFPDRGQYSSRWPRCYEEYALSIAIGTLTIPALLCMSFGYWVLTMEAHDAPPVAVLMGNLTALVVVTPIALLASRFPIKFLSRRALRNVR